MTSWKLVEEWKQMGNWNKTSFVLLWGWLSLLLFSPYLIESGTTGDLSGIVGKYAVSYTHLTLPTIRSV